MNFILRILFFCSILLGISSSGLAGIKKCYKLKQHKSLQTVYAYTHQQQQSTHTGTNNKTTTCINNNIIYIKELFVDAIAYPLNSKPTFPHYISFYLQQYIKPPFAPPQSSVSFYLTSI